MVLNFQHGKVVYGECETVRRIREFQSESGWSDQQYPVNIGWCIQWLHEWCLSEQDFCKSVSGLRVGSVTVMITSLVDVLFNLILSPWLSIRDYVWGSLVNNYPHDERARRVREWNPCTSIFLTLETWSHHIFPLSFFPLSVSMELVNLVTSNSVKIQLYWHMEKMFGWPPSPLTYYSEYINLGFHYEYLKLEFNS
jgi:hypothetical protein